MAQYDLNIRDYLRIFRKRRFTIIVVFLAVTIASALYTLNKPLLYKAKIVIKIEPQRAIMGASADGTMYGYVDVIDSLAQGMKGFSVIKRAAARLGMLNDSYSTEEMDRLIEQLQGSIEAEKLRDTNIIIITATSHNPKQAMGLADAVVEAYAEEDKLQKDRQFRQVSQFMEERLSILENKIIKAEEHLKEFKGPKAQIRNSSNDKFAYDRLSWEVELNKKLYAMLKEKFEEMRIAQAQRQGGIYVINPAIMFDSPTTGQKRPLLLIGAIMGLILGFVFACITETLDTSLDTKAKTSRASSLRA